MVISTPTERAEISSYSSLVRFAHLCQTVAHVVQNERVSNTNTMEFPSITVICRFQQFQNIAALFQPLSHAKRNCHAAC